MSRYYPHMAPLKQGVSRIVSDTLSRQQDNPKFQLSIQTCSITCTQAPFLPALCPRLLTRKHLDHEDLHRNLFRSSVLVTFHKPLVVSAATHPGLVGTPTSQADYSAVRALTTDMGEQIRAGTLDAPSWQYIRLANTARRLYAPLGTRLGLGDHVRLTQRFVDLFAKRKRVEAGAEAGEAGGERKGALAGPMVEAKVEGVEEAERLAEEEREVDALAEDLQTYQDLLYLHGIKDDRIRNPRLLRRRTLWKRLMVRVAGAAFLFAISLPGLLLWTPAFIAARHATAKLKRSGPVFDTYDEVAQTKLVWGLGISVLTLIVANLVCLPVVLVTVPLFPALMWLSLRWLEDCTSSVRAALALFRLLHMGKRQLVLMREMREGLRERVVRVAVRGCGLPEDAGVLEEQSKGWKIGRVVGFFSLQRRRKKDWNEVMRLWDVSEYPADEEVPPEEVARRAGQGVAGGAGVGAAVGTNGFKSE